MREKQAKTHAPWVEVGDRVRDSEYGATMTVKDTHGVVGTAMEYLCCRIAPVWGTPQVTASCGSYHPFEYWRPYADNVQRSMFIPRAPRRGLAPTEFEARFSTLQPAPKRGRNR